MSTKKDLVEAYSFSRRRLVTAFVSGAPGGREVEPARPGRTIIGGLALAILLIAGAAVAGVFKSRADVDWAQPGQLIRDDDSGAIYVILDDIPGLDDPPLRPVVNPTSAQLILGPDADIQSVKQEELDEQQRGPAIGIVDAPFTVSGESQLINSGWTACTGTDLGIKTTVSEADSVTPAPSAGFIVTHKGQDFLIAEAPGSGPVPARAYRYLIPENAPDQLTARLNVADRSSATVVPQQWLELFPDGDTLGAQGLGLTDLGTRPEYAGREGIPAGARIGDYFEVDDQQIVLTADGPSTFSPFAFAVLGALPGSFDSRRLKLPGGTDIDFANESPYATSSWPVDLPSDPIDPLGEVCGVLEPTPGEMPAAHLATDPTGEATAEEVGPRKRDPSVDSGHGAFVLSGEWDSGEGGEPHLIDDRGLSYALVGPNVIGNLGYAEVEEPVVPEAWIELFVEGVSLSVDAALCPPATVDQPACA